ncbi:hypothetical protein E4A47_09170 [Micrococcus flavus]|nr:hypothetical protein E4A47_09170 [Micrococcus flavus]
MGHVTESNHTREPAAADLPTVPAGAEGPAEAPVVVGWREWVGLPDALTPWVKAKVDTGARTSALHAFRIERHTGDHGEDRVRFEVHPWQGSTADARTVDLPVEDVRTVRSSNGEVQDRFVVLMPLRLAGRTVEAEVTLTDRDEMGFRMLVGRTALAQGFLVDPAASYLGGEPPRGVRRRNRGRS